VNEAFVTIDYMELVANKPAKVRTVCFWETKQRNRSIVPIQREGKLLDRPILAPKAD
jgi:hypothetical protein